VLRLARLLETPRDIPLLAYRVGYQSASPFSREYARMFGAAPIRDIEGIRNPTALGAQRSPPGLTWFKAVCHDGQKLFLFERLQPLLRRGAESGMPAGSHFDAGDPPGG